MNKPNVAKLKILFAPFSFNCLATSNNDSPEAITFSWEVATTPVQVKGYKPTAALTIDSTEVEAAKLTAIEEILYGTDLVEPRLPLPEEIATILTTP